MSLIAKISGPVAMTLSMLGGATSALAGKPEPWQIDYQEPATPVMQQVLDFNNLLTFLIIAIVIFVLVLLAYVMIRFRASANPVPSKTTHNALVEVVWTVVPIMILIVIAIPSFKLLYFQDRAVNAEMTIKAVGHQWYWTYEYPDHGDFEFDSLMIADEDIQGDQVRLLETDNRIVLPVDTDVRILVTADDVIHAWTIPAFGVKIDAVPGRLNETWVRIEREGVYYGQCSELCGVYHGFMPITVEALSKEAFAEWVAGAQVEFARNDTPTTVAHNAHGG